LVGTYRILVRMVIMLFGTIVLLLVFHSS